MECKDYISQIERRAGAHGVKLHAMCLRAGIYPHNVWRWKTGRSSPTLRNWKQFTTAMERVLSGLEAQRAVDGNQEGAA